MSDPRLNGPWRVKAGKRSVVDASGIRIVARVEGSDADLALIAAAPELLDALRAVVTAFPDKFGRWEALLARIDGAQ